MSIRVTPGYLDEDNVFHAYGADAGGLAAVIGAVDDEPWDGSGDGTVIAVLKACYAKLAEIATNTEPA